ALADAVHGPLDVGGTGADGDERVGDRAVGVVVHVHADVHPERTETTHDALDDLLDRVRHGAAVGVAQHHTLGARLGGRGDHVEGVRVVARVTVEEVLRV